MKFLPKPLPGIKARKIYEVCASRFEKEPEKSDLPLCADMVQEDAELYDDVMPDGIGRLEPRTRFPGRVTAKMLGSVYEKLRDSPAARDYHEAIMHQVDQDLCPICRAGTPNTLDHYLPRSKMPTLAVVPNNLIPACSECNSAKHDYMQRDPALMPIHLYYDRLPDGIWLKAQIELAPDTVNQVAVFYSVACPDDWDPVLKSRMAGHLSLYKMHERYSRMAVQAMLDNRGLWKILRPLGDETLRMTLENMAASVEKNNLNSWNAALFRGLLRDFDVLCRWLDLKLQNE